MVKVSVIIPVYNTEKYLSHCLDSVINQSLEDIEIICVNDGSADHSADILEQYELKDKRIHVYSQANSYAGVARNTGMTYAKGEYLYFLDSDDYIKEDALAKMYSQADGDGADVCVCGGKNYFEDVGKEMLFEGLLNMKFVPSELPFSIDSWPQYILNFTNVGVWNKLYKRDYIFHNHLVFSKLKRGEDICFAIPALCLAKRITIVNASLVIHRAFRKNGLTSTIDESVGEIIDAWLDTAALLKSYNRYPEQSFENRILKSILAILRDIRTWDVFSSAVSLLKNGKLRELNLTKKEKGYYYVSWQEEMLGHLLEENAGEFALSYIKNMEFRLLDNSTTKKNQSEKFREQESFYKEKIATWEEANRKLKEKNRMLREKNTRLKAKMKLEKENQETDCIRAAN